MKYQIQVHFDNKGIYTFEKDFEMINDLNRWLLNAIEYRDKYIFCGEEEKPFIANMKNVIAITTLPLEENKE